MSWYQRLLHGAWTGIRAHGWRHRDRLTGLGNRRQFELALRRQFDHCCELHKPLSLVHIELDPLNPRDTASGPPAGDRRLRQIAALLGEQVRRPGDLAARLGGDGFALVLPDTPREGAIHLVETLIGQVRRLAVAGSTDVPIPFSISVGLHTGIPDARSTAQQFSGRAKAALHKAKIAGRDGYFADPVSAD
ncbi:GGDEF domain-containing protein [Stenotrophomonas sp. YIM B06876]|uniref:GGDEF domain-containing protein n=1 Tax=Stenotrophomonas sp. YIM B06876 TaxID=3060211 RepID=UPI0027383BF9|nr:GGDEF domain-containing protein [Stenotrophomonas sp. YIM B06876]